MPLYEYECADHGVFDEFRGFAHSSEPAPCPQCQALAPRVLSLPRLREMNPTTVAAMDRNVKNQHQPHVCGSGCGHHHKSVIPVAADGSPKLQKYTGPRPWVVEHA